MQWISSVKTKEENNHTTPCLCAIISVLEVSALMPSHPFVFAASSFMLFLRISICSLHALINAVTCRNCCYRKCSGKIVPYLKKIRWPEGQSKLFSIAALMNIHGICDPSNRIEETINSSLRHTIKPRSLSQQGSLSYYPYGRPMLNFQASKQDKLVKNNTRWKANNINNTNIYFLYQAQLIERWIISTVSPTI